MSLVVSYSGGKDSTAMVHVLLERGETIDAILFTRAWDFPCVFPHNKLLEEKTGLKITTLHPEPSLEHWMYEHPVKASSGPNKGKVHQIGCGWPSRSRAWCSRQKGRTMDRYVKKHFPGAVRCIGYAVDEYRRAAGAEMQKMANARFPLIERDMTGTEALQYCYELGYHWDGYYRIFTRLSCFCCPQQSIDSLRKLRRHRPQLWKELLEMDARQPPHSKGFRGYERVADIEKQFAEEDQQMHLFDLKIE